MVSREIVWQAHEWPGLEHVTFRDLGAAEWSASGTVIAALPSATFKLTYEIEARGAACRLIAAIRTAHGTRSVELAGDGAGSWADGTGASIPALRGCTDVDLAVTPITNTLPIRRLGLAPGEAASLEVAYVQVPSLSVRRSRQMYRRLDRHAARPRYEYTSGRFRAELTTDRDATVLTYSTLWSRLTP